MPKVTLAEDYDCDTFGVYVDGKLVYDYDQTNLNEILRALCLEFGFEFEYDTKGFGSEEENPDCVVPTTLE